MSYQNFTDVEYCIDKYFEENLAKRLGEFKEMRESRKISALSTGFGVRNALFPSEEYANDATLSYQAKDIERLTDELRQDKSVKKDVGVLIEAWRETAIGQIGKEKYAQLSKKLGCDMAEAYVNHRLTMKMVDFEVEKSSINSVEYILDETRRNSLLLYLSKPTSELQKYIDKKIIERYDPSALEKGAGKVLGSLTDYAITFPLTGGVGGTWAGLAKFVAVDLGLGAAMDIAENKAEKDCDVSLLTSEALFGTKKDVLSQIRKNPTNPYSSEIIKSIDDNLEKKIVYHSRSILNEGYQPKIGIDLEEMPKIPDYTEQLKTSMDMHYAIEDHFGRKESTEGKIQTSRPLSGGEQIMDSIKRNTEGWGGFLDQFKLKGFGDVFQNLGYVLAMLPDMIVGMFTGKSRNLKFKDNMMPIAAVLMGMFVKNPMLKMLLIGLGGANLLNRAGQEALEDGRGQQPAPKYVAHADEELDLRIKQPIMRGNTLVANIDDVPVVVKLESHVVDAYEKGMLPLNTLSNAVLRHYDEQNTLARESYDRQVDVDQNIEQSRGIK